MFNSRRIEALERDLSALYDVVSRQNEDLEMILKDFYEAPVSPAKAPKKRGKGEVGPKARKEHKRKYVKSGKYAKVTTKKK